MYDLLVKCYGVSHLPSLLALSHAEDAKETRLPSLCHQHNNIRLC
jgi:hypothetical protein